MTGDRQHLLALARAPFENGDRMRRDEFLRLYWQAPGLKAELVEGVVFMPSPVSTKHHGTPHVDLVFWLACYRMLTPGVVTADNATLLLDGDNSFQPDVFMMVDPACGGRTRTIDDLTAGAPELVAEIASSSRSRDLHAKLDVYRRNGVRDYVVWRTRDAVLDWFVLEDGDYRLQEPRDGLLDSAAFPGLRLDVAALLAGRLADVQAAVQAGCATPAHAGFRAALAAAKGPPA